MKTTELKIKIDSILFVKDMGFTDFEATALMYRDLQEVASDLKVSSAVDFVSKVVYLLGSYPKRDLELLMEAYNTTFEVPFLEVGSGDSEIDLDNLRAYGF